MIDGVYYMALPERDVPSYEHFTRSYRINTDTRRELQLLGRDSSRQTDQDTVAGGTASQRMLSHGVRQHSHQTVIKEFASSCASVPSAQRPAIVPGFCVVKCANKVNKELCQEISVVRDCRCSITLSSRPMVSCSAFSHLLRCPGHENEGSTAF